MEKYRLSKKERVNLIRIAICLLAFIVLFAIDKGLNLASVLGGDLGWLLPMLLYLAVYLAIGYDVILRAARNILNGQVFDENFLMVIATFGAFGLAIFRGATGGEIEGFDEACAVLLFYQVGEFFQRYATGKSRKSISALMDIRPDYANLISDGEIKIVDPEAVEVGQVILVNPGEKVPLDGVCVKGSSSLDTKALTGEALPRDIEEGSKVVSGSINLSSQFEMRVEKRFYDSTVSKILDLVENAADKKSKTENFITKFARFYTPTVVGLALLIAIIPSAITGEWAMWIYRALSFLVVSCPCALVISIPLSFFAGLGLASHYGILIKGSDYIEKLSKANIFVFDKTGTLTKGNFAVSKANPPKQMREILKFAAICEQGSSHPIARSILSAYDGDVDCGYTTSNISGKGVVASKNDDIILCGNQKLMEKYGIEFVPCNEIGTAVYVARNGEFVGSILISDEIKTETKETISNLSAQGARTVMLTGDNEAVASAVASEIGLSDYKSSLLPEGKVDEVERLLSAKDKKDVLCFVGDGINDAPVLMRADIGIAMGGVGSDAAIEAADIVLMKDDLSQIPRSKKIAKKTMRVVLENIVFSLGVKVAILLLSALGITNMWIAVFGDVGVAIIAILNAMRVGLERKKNKKQAI